MSVCKGGIYLPENRESKIQPLKNSERIFFQIILGMFLDYQIWPNKYDKLFCPQNIQWL